MPQKKYTILSLFSGCGGMDLGFLGGFKFLNKNYRKLPFKILYANEISKFAAKTYAHNFGHQPQVEDINNIDVATLPDVDVVLGGFPCQPFSNAGKRQGKNDEKGRGNLYLQMKKVIQQTKPKMFVAENVDGLRTHTENGTKTLDTIIKDLGENYNVEYKVLKAVDYGIPQTRVRIIIVGIRKDLTGKFVYPAPTIKTNKHTRLPKYVTTKDAIDDLWELLNKPEAPQNHTSKDYSKAKFQPGKFSQGNSKEQADKPAHTVRAEAHGNQYAHYNSVGDNPRNPDMHTWRRLTVRECARLQSFPDTFEFPVSQTEAHKQIGNAVPPVLAWHIANSVKQTLQIIDFTLDMQNKLNKQVKVK